MSQKKSIYRIRFINHNTVYELYARSIAEGELFGFIEVEQLIFGENTSLVIDPSEERLKAEFNEVKCTYIPLHTILRIDVVEREGVAKVISSSTGDGCSISMFPNTMSTISKIKRSDKPE